MYDKDNRYTGVLIARLGGRPATKDRPSKNLEVPRALSYFGNIPITLPSYQLQLDPLKRFPEGVEVTPIEPAVRPIGRIHRRGRRTRRGKNGLLGIG